MPHHAPIVLIENDSDDRLFITDALRELGVANPVRLFADGSKALEYLRTTPEQPFLILCDIVMYPMGGLELRRTIDGDDALRRKSIPFVFLTDYATEAHVQEAYDLTVQGFYRKAPGMTALKEQLALLLAYWRDCLHPNRYFSR